MIIPIAEAAGNVMTQGLILMAAGMGAVYLFLVILIFVMKGAALGGPKLDFMLPDPQPAAPKAAAPKADDGAAIAVAIAAAIQRSRG